MYYPNRWIQSIDTRTAAGRRISRYEYEYDVHGNRTLLREWNATPAWRAAHPAWETDPDEVAEHEVTAYAYDRLDRLTGVTYRHGTAEQRAVAYTYDRLGNRLSEIETKLDGTPVKNRSFACDRHGRLLTVTDHLAPGRSVRYEYNAAGDTLSKTVVQLDGSGGIVPGTETLRMNFGWDAWGRLRRVTRQTAAVGKWSQAKTGDGRRETGAESGQTSAGTAVYALGEEELVAEFCYDHAGRRVRHDSRFVFLGDDAGGPGDPVPADTRLYVYDEMSALAEFTFDPSLPNDPDALLKTRQYLFGNELLAAESVPPSPPPPPPRPRVNPPEPRAPSPEPRFLPPRLTRLHRQPHHSRWLRRGELPLRRLGQLPRAGPERAGRRDLRWRRRLRPRHRPLGLDPVPRRHPIRLRSEPRASSPEPRLLEPLHLHRPRVRPRNRPLLLQGPLLRPRARPLRLRGPLPRRRPLAAKPPPVPVRKCKSAYLH